MVFTVKVPLAFPEASTSVACTVAEALLEPSVSVSPPLGAGPVSVTVAVELDPPMTEAGLRTSELRTGARIFSVADWLVPLRLAEIDVPVSEATAVVFTVKVAEVFPAGTVILAGTVAAALPLVSFSEMPPVGAAPLRVTVPVELVPPVTEAGLRVTAVRVGGRSVTVVVTEVPPHVAVIVEDFSDAVPIVVTVKLAELWPERILTLAGTFTPARLLLRSTVAPAEGALPFRLTAPKPDAPP